jgi:hypothetical protein|tara:strand:+ start:668 stop:895 length:228 start_codon:yes stop_codon:yes gene_type:complete
MDIREKANQASAILNNPVFQDCIESIRQNLITQWTNAVDSVSDREECWLKLNALSLIQEDLQATIQNFKIENNER